MRRDLVIIGGGPAGLSAALHLIAYSPALAARTVVLEKCVFPRDKTCAGAIATRGMRRLEKLGVMLDVPFEPVNALSLRVGDTQTTIDEPGLGKVVRRLEFDHALVNEAIRRGVQVHQGAHVLGVEPTPSEVRVHIAGQPTICARAVIGADGVAGVVRRSVGLVRGRLRGRAVEVDTERTDADPRHDSLHFDLRYRDLNGYAWDFPTIVDGQRKVCRGVYLIANGTKDSVRSCLARHLRERGLDLADYRLKHFAERGFEPNQRISWPRVLLIGEAAGIDIATGEGIPQAIAYGELAARYVAAAFRDRTFGFGDWRREVCSCGVGKRLRIRHAVFKLFFGPDRSIQIDRLVARRGRSAR